MSASGSRWIKVFGVLTVLGTGVIFAAVAVVYAAGTIRVQVRGTRPGGVDLDVPVPVALLDAGVGFIPEEQRREIVRELGPWKPAIRELLEEMAHCPDGPFVQVDAADGKVTIVKRDGKLIVDVDSKDGGIHLKVPVNALPRLFDRIAGRKSGLVEL